MSEVQSGAAGNEENGPVAASAGSHCPLETFLLQWILLPLFCLGADVAREEVNSARELPAGWVGNGAVLWEEAAGKHL
jgi:hypothetical protein